MKDKKKTVGRPAKIDDAVITHFYISGKDNDELRRWAKLAGVSVAELTRTLLSNGILTLNGEEVNYDNIKLKCRERLDDVDEKLRAMRDKRERLAAELNAVVA